MTTKYSGNPGNVTTPLQRTVNGCADNGSGKVRVSTSTAHLYSTFDVVTIGGVTGTTEANGTFAIVVIDSTHFDLPTVSFVNPYVSGGTASDNSLTPAATLPSDGEQVTVSSILDSLQLLLDRTQYLTTRAPWVVAEDVLVAGTSGVTLASNGTNTYVDALLYSSITGVLPGDRIFITGGCIFEDGGTACILEVRLCADDGTVHALITQKGDFDAAADAYQGTYSGKFTATTNANVTLRLQFRNTNNAQTILAIGQAYFAYKHVRG